MIAGIEFIEAKDGLVIKDTDSPLGEEYIYQRYKNVEVLVDGYLLYELAGHTGEYCIRFKNNLVQIE